MPSLAYLVATDHELSGVLAQLRDRCQAADAGSLPGWVRVGSPCARHAGVLR
jgi:hypothetical protein